MFWCDCNNIYILLYLSVSTEGYQVLLEKLLKLHRITVLKKKYRKPANSLPPISQ